MKYSDFIHVNEGFQTSVNLEYDLNIPEKVKGYIPTEQSVRVLGEFLKSFYYSNDTQSRANVLVGPYGRGKSHLLLVLSAITSLDMFAISIDEREESFAILEELCDKIYSVNEEVGALAREIVQSGIRTLPVIINSNFNDINQSFLLAINDALAKANLQHLLPATYFDSAISIIKKWETNFPEAYKKLVQELKKKKIKAEDLLVGLCRFDQEAYSTFCDCYPQIAAGTAFNPMTNMDVVKLYQSVVDALVEQTEYSGINIIFDEFSKFLESNIDKSKMLNFKIIQDVAELASRSGKKQIHFTCITHKEILDYSSSDSFKTVEGRFKHIKFVASSEQSYELISNAIVKDVSFAAFKKSHHAIFAEVCNKSALIDVFSDLEPDSLEEKLLYGCFPLTPLSAYALLNISELVGQNERTLFTFLAQDGEFTFQDFLRKEHETIEFITPDYIYTYFEELFRKEVFNAKVHSIWKKTDAALRQAKEEAQVRILQAMAVISMIGNERLKNTKAHLKAALLMDDAVFEQAMRFLQKEHIVSQRDTSEYVLLTANGVDVQKSVEAYVKSKSVKVDVGEMLNEICDNGFVFPREHNDRFSILRYFKKVYMGAKEFVNFKNAKQLLTKYQYDGLIIYIVGDASVDRDRIESKIKKFANHPQIIICISDLAFDQLEVLKRIEAISRLKEENVQNPDPHYMEEMEIYEQDLNKRIQSHIDMMFAPRSQYSTYLNCVELLDIDSQVRLIQTISRICNDCYNLTPVINNEMVNKNVLNAQNIKGRDLVIQQILDYADSNVIPCMDGYGQEVSIFKSVLSRTGLDQNPRTQDAGLNEVLELIHGFIADCEVAKNNFEQLYQTLCAAPYGLRKGIIPILIAYELRQYKEGVIFYFKDKEMELTPGLLANLNEAPANYQLLIEAGTAEKEQYLVSLEQIFADNADVRTTSINHIYSVVKSMQNWVRSLPEYTKKFRSYWENGETRTIDAQFDSFRRELMKFEVNSRELVFDSFVSIFAAENQLQNCAESIARCKAFFDGHIKNCRMEISKMLIALFMPGYQGGLAKSMMAWYKKLPDSTKKHVFDSNSNALLGFAAKISTYDDDAILDELMYEFASMEIEDWSDSLANNFIKDVADAIAKINDYHEDPVSGENECMVSISLTGTKLEKTFSSSNISPLGKTVINNLRAVFEEYNGALETDEQLAILAQLIEDIIN